MRWLLLVMLTWNVGATCLPSLSWYSSRISRPDTSLPSTRMVSLTSPGWIVLAGLLSRAVCVQRAMCSSRCDGQPGPGFVQAVDLGDERPVVVGPGDRRTGRRGRRGGTRACRPSSPRG